MFGVSCLGIWWWKEIWISEKLKLDYLENKKSFQNEIKKYFSFFHKCSSFRLTKQNSKNVVDTAFKGVYSKNNSQTIKMSQVYIEYKQMIQ